LQCQAKSGGTDTVGASGAVTVEVTAPASLKVVSYDVGAGATAKSAAAFASGGVANVDGVTAGSPFALTVNVTDATTNQASAVKCSVSVSASPPKDTPKATPTTFDPQIDLAAMASWRKDGVTMLDDLRKDGLSKGLPPNTQFLVHLPSGAPAFPFPNSVREGTPVQVVVLAPQSQTAPISITVTACADVQTFRLEPTANTGRQAASEKFNAIPIGAWFKCGAGTASYSLAFGTGDGAKTAITTIRMRSVYSFAVTFLVGYDTAPTASFATSGQGGTEHVIENASNVGLAGYVGGAWMVGGVDYEDMRWYNYFANPFIAVNPASPTKDAVAGLAFTPAGGVSVALGVSFHERTALNGYSVGEAFTGDGTVPTQSTWSGFTPGFFIGAAVDSNVYNAAKALGSSK
jgi:hypothetical protein